MINILILLSRKHIKDALSNLNYLEQEREFNSFKKNFEHKEERGHCILPLPNVFNLELFLALLQETPLEDRNVISSELTVRVSWDVLAS